MAFLALMLSGACALSLLVSARAEQPKIELITLFLTDSVLIHFDLEANLNCELQYTETLTTNGVPGGTWTNLYVPDKSTSFQHYIVVDTRMRPQRFYRLHVFP